MHLSPPRNLQQRRNAGFSLIEVLVTVVVVAIGLLAVAGLQAVSKKAGYDAVQRSTAAALAQGMIERIRANPGQAAIYAPGGGLVISESQLPAPVGCNPVPNGVLDAGSGAACSADQTAKADLYAWSQELFGAAEALPAAGSSAAEGNLGGLQHAFGCITRTRCGAVDVYAVAVAWRGPTPIAAADSDTQDPSASACGAYDAGYLPPPTVDGTMTLRRVLVLQAAVLNTAAAAAPPC